MRRKQVCRPEKRLLGCNRKTWAKKKWGPLAMFAAFRERFTSCFDGLTSPLARPGTRHITSTRPAHGKLPAWKAASMVSYQSQEAYE